MAKLAATRSHRMGEIGSRPPESGANPPLVHGTAGSASVSSPCTNSIGHGGRRAACVMASIQASLSRTVSAAIINTSDSPSGSSKLGSWMASVWFRFVAASDHEEQTQPATSANSFG